MLQKVADGELTRVMIFMPPRHGKSETLSRLFSAYYLYRHPERFVGLCSYAAELAYTLSRAARENYKSAGGQTKNDADAVKHWETPAGGGFWAAGVGGPITGKGFHLGIIDDPIKNAEDAASEVIREKHWDWFGSTFYTREEPGGAIIVNQTRWNEDDLSGRILVDEAKGEEPEGWHIVNFEAIKEADQPEFPPTCTVEADWRKPGEPLCLERYSLEKLAKLAKRLGSYFFTALFQQRPAPKDGKIFKASWFASRYKSLPPIKEVWTCWDTALTEKEQNDETASVTVALAENGNLYPLRVTHGHWETPDVAKFLCAQADWLKGLYGDRYKGDYIENKMNGLTLIQFVRRTRPDLALIPVNVEADKVARAQGVTPLCEAGRIILPDLAQYPEARSWVEDLLVQLTTFPNAKRKDIVDAFVYALKRMMGTLRTGSGKRKGGRYLDA